MRRVALATLALVAGCDRPAATPKSDIAAGAPENPVAATPSRQIGTVSGLSGTQSGLKGLVSGFEVRRTATETVATLAADTLFAFDSADIAPAAADNLGRTAALVREGGEGQVRVIGHTDAKGDDAYNDDLSRRRAQAVATWLAGPGSLSSRDFAVEGRGRREPVAANSRPDGSDDPAGRARNRRVVVVIPR